ncbi:uncharacterized protein TNCV_4711861 [Trichonephila clavipes]|nr:uncharacterized protein TNCV_4711861 [Trichonephila clavipes]
MVSDGTEFAVGDIEKLFDEARRNTNAKHEKWAKYYDRRRRDVQINVNDWVLAKTRKQLRVLEVKQNNLRVWRSGKRERITVNVDQVGLYHHRKSDEMEIRTSSSDNISSSYKSNNFEGRQPRLNELQCSRKNWSGYGRDETVMPSTSGYNLRPRRGSKVESRPANEKRTQQGGPVRSRGSREKQHYRLYAEEQRRSSSRNTRSRSGQQQHGQERK